MPERTSGISGDEGLAVYDFNTDLVLLLSSVPTGRALNGDGYIAVSRGNTGPIRVQPVGRDGRVRRIAGFSEPARPAGAHRRTSWPLFRPGRRALRRRRFPRTEASLATYAIVQADIRAGSRILIAGEIKGTGTASEGGGDRRRHHRREQPASPVLGQAARLGTIPAPARGALEPDDASDGKTGRRG
jgi:hypothetical protein